MDRENKLWQEELRNHYRRNKKEREELNELLEMQKTEELNELRMAVQKSGMEISEIIQLAQMQTAQ